MATFDFQPLPNMVSPCPSLNGHGSHGSLASLDSGVKSGKDYLPLEYSPGPFEVIVGRGRRVLNHNGNKILRSLLKAELPSYTLAIKKPEKTQVITRILDTIRSRTDIGWGFIKRESSTNRWYAVTEVVARSTIAQLFRDSLSEFYRSSRQEKLKRRKQTAHLKGKSSIFQDVDRHTATNTTLTGALEAHVQNQVASNGVPPAASAPPSPFPVAEARAGSKAAGDKELFNTLWFRYLYESKNKDSESDPFEPTPIAPKLLQKTAASA